MTRYIVGLGLGLGLGLYDFLNASIDFGMQPILVIN